jgi:hypothetical protein
MANKFRIGDLVTWEHGDGSPDHIARFGWQYQQAYLSRAPGMGAPVTELKLTPAPEPANFLRLRKTNIQPTQAAWKPDPPVQSGTVKPTDTAGEWHPDPPKLHTGPEAWTQRG